MAPTIRRANPEDAAALGDLIAALLAELAGMSVEAGRADSLAAVARALLSECEGFAALIAEDGEGRAIAVLTLSECYALYAGGRFGEIAELYVVSDQRSTRLGARMLEAAKELARERGWPRLEVGAPDMPRWQRTLEFYRRCGFEEVGPRLQLPLD